MTITTSIITGNPVHAIALLPGDDIHLAPHDIYGTDYTGHHWHEHIEPHLEADVHVDRVRREGPDLVTVHWWLGTMTGATVYGPTSLVPLLRRAA